MAHGRPDWLLGSGRRTTYRWAEFDELAARLGSPVTFDRRGDVVFLDSFEDGLEKWTKTFIGGAGAVDLSVERARTGAFSCRMRTSAGPAGGVQISRGTPALVPTTLGVEHSFHVPVAIEYLRLGVAAYDGAVVTLYEVRWRDSSDDLQYLDASYAWVTFATGVELGVLIRTFHTWKLVVDAEAKEYVHLLLDDSAYSLAGIAAYQEPAAVAPYYLTAITMAGRAGETDTVYVDDVILTQNEL